MLQVHVNKTNPDFTYRYYKEACHFCYEICVNFVLLTYDLSFYFVSPLFFFFFQGGGLLSMNLISILSSAITFKHITCVCTSLD